MNLAEKWDKITEFYSWFYSVTGLESWQVLIIGSAILILLLMLLMYLRRSRIREIHIIHSKNRPEVIGARLSGGSGTNRRTKHHPKDEDFSDEDEARGFAWGQSTKQWRQLKEHNIRLQHELKRYQKSEERYKKQIAELKTAYEDLQKKIKEYKKNEETRLGSKIDNLPVTEKPMEFEADKQTSESSQTDNIIDEELTESPGREDFVKTEINQTAEIAAKDQEEPNEERGVLLDIKELKAISDLAKRLQERNHNRPGQ